MSTPAPPPPPAALVPARIADGDPTIRADDRNRLRMIRAASAMPGMMGSLAPSTTAASGGVGTKSTLG